MFSITVYITVFNDYFYWFEYEKAILHKAILYL